MSDLKLSLAEIYTCLALAQGVSLIGLDLEERVPEDAPSRQTLYEEGEASLQRRDLLRVKRSGEAQLENGLLSAALSMSHPDLVVLTFVTVRDQGGFRLIHYYRDGEIWRAAISADNDYLLRAVPDASLVGLDLAAAVCTGAELKRERANRVSMKALLEMVRHSAAGQSPDTRLLGALSADPGFTEILAGSLQQLERHATISLMQATPEGTRTHELLFLRTTEECWVALQDNETDAVVSTIDQPQTSDLLVSLFGQLM